MSPSIVSDTAPETALIQHCIELEVCVFVLPEIESCLRPGPGGVFSLDSITGRVGGNHKENSNFYDLM